MCGSWTLGSPTQRPQEMGQCLGRGVLSTRRPRKGERDENLGSHGQEQSSSWRHQSVPGPSIIAVHAAYEIRLCKCLLSSSLADFQESCGVQIFRFAAIQLWQDIWTTVVVKKTFQEGSQDCIL